MKRGKFLKKFIFLFTCIFAFFAAPNLVKAFRAEVIGNENKYVVVQESEVSEYSEEDYIAGITCFDNDENDTEQEVDCGNISHTKNLISQHGLQEITFTVNDSTNTVTSEVTKQFFVIMSPIINSSGNEGAATTGSANYAIALDFNNTLVGGYASAASDKVKVGFEQKYLGPIANDGYAGLNAYLLVSSGTVNIDVLCASTCTSSILAVTEYYFAPGSISLDGTKASLSNSYTSYGTTVYESSGSYNVNFTVSSNTTYGVRQLYYTLFVESSGTYNVYEDTITYFYVANPHNPELSIDIISFTPIDKMDYKWSIVPHVATGAHSVFLGYSSTVGAGITDIGGLTLASDKSSSIACVSLYSRTETECGTVSDVIYDDSVTFFLNYFGAVNSSTSDFRRDTAITETIPLLTANVSLTGCLENESIYYCNKGDTITITFSNSSNAIASVSGTPTLVGATTLNLYDDGNTTTAVTTIA